MRTYEIWYFIWDCISLHEGGTLDKMNSLKRDWYQSTFLFQGIWKPPQTGRSFVVLLSRCLSWGETFCSLLVARYFLLVARYFLLVARCSLLFARCSLLVPFCPLLVTFCSLLDKKSRRTFFLSQSKQKVLHIILYKKFNLWITLKLR